MARKHLPAKQLFAANLTRIVEADKRTAGEIGVALGLAPAPGKAAQNLFKYMGGERWPRPEMLDRMAGVLGVARADFFLEGR